MNKSIKFSNPRSLAVFPNWPAAHLTTTRFFGVLIDDKGRERGISWTTGKPQQTRQWHDWVRIADGSDNMTYVICYSFKTDTVTIYPGSLKTILITLKSGLQFQQIKEWVEQ